MIDVVAAVIEEGGRILACRRSPDRQHGGLWEFPGGKVEPGETPEQALVREIHEELTVEIEPLEHFTTVEKGELRLIFIRARLLTDRPTGSTDHDRLRWLTLQQLGSVEWAPSDRVAVSRLTAQPGEDVR